MRRERSADPFLLHSQHLLSQSEELLAHFQDLQARAKRRSLHAKERRDPAFMGDMRRFRNSLQNHNLELRRLCGSMAAWSEKLQRACEDIERIKHEMCTPRKIKL
jgi:hypothetical protein